MPDSSLEILSIGHTFFALLFLFVFKLSCSMKKISFFKLCLNMLPMIMNTVLSYKQSILLCLLLNSHILNGKYFGAYIAWPNSLMLNNYYLFFYCHSCRMRRDEFLERPIQLTEQRGRYFE